MVSILAETAVTEKPDEYSPFSFGDMLMRDYGWQIVIIVLLVLVFFYIKRLWIDKK